MYVDRINKIVIPRFITDGRYSIFRHAVLFFSIAVIVLNIQVKGENVYAYGEYIEYGIRFAFFFGILYLNMYFLVPRFLLKNKVVAYSASILGCAFVLLLSLCIIQFLLHRSAMGDDKDFLYILFNLGSVLIVLMLVIIYTTSFILFKNWMQSHLRLMELEMNTLHIELQHLKNQINPHFLFNMLNNASIMVKQDPVVASQMLFELDKLLSYQLEGSVKDTVLLDDDILFLTSYLELEKTRRNRFEYTLSRPNENFRNLQVPPLLFIPFVENAVKHSAQAGHLSYVHITFRVDNNCLFFYCENSIPSVLQKKKEGGLGLSNIRKRLELLYGDAYSLKTESGVTNYSVSLEIHI